MDVDLPRSLHYSSDESPGWRRVKQGDHFQFIDANGKAITNKSDKDRIAALVIPPAWTDVWIFPSPQGHLQATGRDAKNRKQAIYHTKWHEARAEHKFEHLKEIGLALPKVRSVVADLLAQRGHSREKVLAAIVQLLDSTMIRIGNHQYEVQNKSYGLTTLRNKHAHVIADRVEFNFVGKSRKAHSITLKNRTLSRVVRQCQELPGQHLFTYVDRDKVVHEISSTEVNNFLREVSKTNLTAKEFRTWGGSVEAVKLIRESHPGTPKELASVVKLVAEKLGNTPAVFRQSYIHPKALDIHPEPSWITASLPRARKHLDPVEVLFLTQILD